MKKQRKLALRKLNITKLNNCTTIKAGGLNDHDASLESIKCNPTVKTRTIVNECNEHSIIGGLC
ncbi:hypothetical protein [Kordia sp.]|uniref:hypothetical protein n=1 Tax=Kordia sp. TaxID=1965332 RepID=UPI003D2BAC12